MNNTLKWDSRYIKWQNQDQALLLNNSSILGKYACISWQGIKLFFLLFAISNFTSKNIIFLRRIKCSSEYFQEYIISILFTNFHIL